MNSDEDLLAQYTATRDPIAFTEITQRYRALVFSAARRMAGNHHDAEDVTQNCFVELAQQADRVQGPLAGWLHLRATSRALNSVRGTDRRKEAENRAAKVEEAPLVEATWEVVGPLIDQAIAELPEELRLPVVLYYLQGFDQEEVARTLKISRLTASRRIRIGIDRIRKRIGSMHIVASIGVLSALLKENAIASVSPSLRVSLAKIGMSGIGPKSSPASSRKSYSMPRGVIGGLLSRESLRWAVPLTIGATGLALSLRLFFPPTAPVYDRIEDAFAPYLSSDPSAGFSWHAASLEADDASFWRGSQPLFFSWCKENASEWMQDRNSFLLCHGNARIQDTARSIANFDLDESAYLPLQVELLQGLISVRVSAGYHGRQEDVADPVSVADALCTSFKTSMLANDDVSFVQPEHSNLPDDLARYLDEAGHFRTLVRGKHAGLLAVLRPCPFSLDQLAGGIESSMQSSPQLSALLLGHNPGRHIKIKEACQAYRADSAAIQDQQQILALLDGTTIAPAKDILLEITRITPTAAELSGVVPIDPREPAERAVENAELLSRGCGLPVGWCQLDGASFVVRLHVADVALDSDSEREMDPIPMAKLWGTLTGACHRSESRRSEFAEMITPSLQAALIEKSNAYLAQLKTDLNEFHSDPRVARDEMQRNAVIAAWVGQANRDAVRNGRKLP